PPFIQALNFAFGFGALAGPLIAEPFLELFTSLEYPYGITGILSLAIVILFGVVYLVRRSNDAHPSRKEAEKANEKSPVSSTKHYLTIFVTCTFIFFYIGLELSFGTMLTTYVVNSDLKLNKSTASYMTSLYWGTFTFFRCFTIFVVDYLGSQNLLISNLILIMASNFVLLPFGNTYEWALWLGIVLMGFGTSPIFGAIFGFLQEFIFISSKTSSLIFVSGCTGQLIIPYLIGNFVDKNP
ncbi:Sodium-dependent glucose transporter 1-like protein, partial [Dinothrombium tinctorium]